MSHESFLHEAKVIKYIGQEEFAFLAEIDGEPAGFVIVLPDYHHVFKTIGSERRRGLVGSDRAQRWIVVRLLLWISLLGIRLLAVPGLLILRLTILLLILRLSILLRVLGLPVILLSRGILAHRGAGAVG